MRYKYNLYPDAREKLDSTGITARVIAAKDRHEIGNTGCIMQSDISDMVNDMKARGYFATFPQDKLADFKAKANSLFATPENRKWLVHKHDKVHEEGIENEDVLSLVGYDASLILKPDEIWNFEKFGFRNMTDFTGSVTALISDVIHSSPFRRGYT